MVAVVTIKMTALAVIVIEVVMVTVTHQLLQVPPATSSIHSSLATLTSVSIDLGSSLSVPLSTRTSSRGHLTGFNGELNAALMD